MHKSDRLYKLSKGSDTAMWAHDEIVNQDNRIVELKEAVKRLTDAVSLFRQDNYNTQPLIVAYKEALKEPRT